MSSWRKPGSFTGRRLTKTGCPVRLPLPSDRSRGMGPAFARAALNDGGDVAPHRHNRRDCSAAATPSCRHTHPPRRCGISATDLTSVTTSCTSALRFEARFALIGKAGHRGGWSNRGNRVRRRGPARYRPLTGIWMSVSREIRMRRPPAAGRDLQRLGAVLRGDGLVARPWRSRALAQRAASDPRHRRSGFSA